VPVPYPAGVPAVAARPSTTSLAPPRKQPWTLGDYSLCAYFPHLDGAKVPAAFVDVNTTPLLQLQRYCMMPAALLGCLEQAR
jgi:hypothetical protein